MYIKQGNISLLTSSGTFSGYKYKNNMSMILYFKTLYNKYNFLFHCCTCLIFQIENKQTVLIILIRILLMLKPFFFRQKMKLLEPIIFKTFAIKYQLKNNTKKLSLRKKLQKPSWKTSSQIRVTIDLKVSKTKAIMQQALLTLLPWCKKWKKFEEKLRWTTQISDHQWICISKSWLQFQSICWTCSNSIVCV